MTDIDLSDADFYDKIDETYSQYRIKPDYLRKTFGDFCFPKTMTFQPSQLFLPAFINPNTDFLRLLIYHKIGSGKTCTAVRIAEQFKNTDIRILVVLPAALKENFRKELLGFCAQNAYITSSEARRLRGLNTSDENYKIIMESVNARIDQVYTILSYQKFTKALENGDLNLNDTLLIIDEIHNLINAKGVFYNILYKHIHAAMNLRLVLLTATIIFDKPNEIGLAMNLLRTSDMMPIGSEFNEMFIETVENDKGQLEYNVQNIDTFMQYLKGYVSYYKGAPDMTFPRMNFNVERVKMSNLQHQTYLQTIRVDMDHARALNILDNVNNHFLILSRMVSNICYPNGLLKEEGFESLDRKALSQMNQFSPKMVRMIQYIRDAIGPVFIYSNFKKYGGIMPLVAYLESLGYVNFNEHGPGEKRYATWTGGDKDNVKIDIHKTFNSEANKNGSQIRIIIGSPSVKEGISFRNVDQVHMLEPYWNWSRMDQIIGRAFRFCSHRTLPESRRQVHVFLYIAYHPNVKMSCDEHILQMATVKETINSKFNTYIKESAIDCNLFHVANSTNKDPIVCANQYIAS